jgi:hypothetical protein
MADRIKGLTIEIDGNTTKLSKALEGVNKDIRSTQTQLKDVEKLLKLDPGNIDLLRQKEELLNKAVTDTADKLGTLKTALAQMDASGVDKSSAEYQALQREIIATENSLKDLKREAELSNATLAKIGETAKKVGDGAKKVADSTRGLSTAAGGALVALGGVAVKAGENADELLTMAKQTGLSTDALQKMAYASDLIDVDVNTITSAVAKMKKGLDSNADTFEKIGVAVKNANGEYRSTEDIFNDTVAALGQIENETERDIVAMDIFGKSADELAGLIDDGGAAMRALGEEAQNSGAIISEDDLKKAGEFNDSLDKIKAQLSGSFGQAAVKVLQALTPVLETVAGVISNIADKLSTLSPETIQIIAIVASVVAAISPIAGIISAIATAISVITPIIAAVNAVIAANPVVLVIMAIVAAIGLLVAAGVAIAKNWDAIKEKASEIWGAITEKFNAIKDAVVEKFNAVKEKVSETFNNIKDAAAEKFNAVKEGVSFALNAAKEVASEKLGAMKKAFEENGGGIKGAMAGAWEGIKGAYTAGFSFIDKLTGGKLTEIKDAIFGKFKEIIDKAKTWGKDLIQNLIDGITGMIDKVKDTVGNIAQTIKDFLGFSEPDEGPLSNFHTFMPDMIDLMTKGIDENLYKVQDSMNNLAQTMVPNTNINVDYNDSGVTSRLDSIGESLSQPQPVAVNVVLQGDAQGVFKLVRNENDMYIKSTGASAFA